MYQVDQEVAGIVGHESQGFKLHTVSELLDLPDPEWLIDGMVEKEAMTMLFGHPGAGKSFVALDWALSVATGREWFGRPVAPGPVVYLAAEGGTSIKKRVRAWMQHNQVQKVSDVSFILRAVQLLDPADVTAVINALEPKKPVLIVLDTLSRCSVGADENSSKDMSKAVDAVATMQQKTGAAVLLVHHSVKKDGSVERGSSALQGAADVIVCQKRDKTSELITIDNTKQKDEEEFEDVHARLQKVILEPASAEKREVSSCVVVPAPPKLKVAGEAAQVPNGPEQHALDVLLSLGSATSGKWRSALVEQGKELPSTKTFDNWRKALVDKGYVKKKGTLYSPTAKPDEVPNATGTLTAVA